MELDTRLLQKVADYKPDTLALERIRSTPIVFTVGIAGAGKDSVQQELIRRYADEYMFVLSHVTRKPRSNRGILEQEGVEYHFIDFQTAEKMLDQGQYVEASIIHYEDIYGTTIEEIQKITDAGKIAITDLDIKGVQKCVDLAMNVKPVFLVPPSYEVWWQRFQTRYGDLIDWGDVKRRMKSALEELQFALDHDYFYIIVNEDLAETVDVVNRIAHGEDIGRHTASAVAVTQQLAASIAEKLAHWQDTKPGL